MTAFWTAGAVLAAALLAFLLRPLLSRRAPPISRSGANVAIYRQQLEELESDLAAGTLAPADYERARAELEARLLDDVARPEAPVRRAGGGKAALLVGVAVPLLGFALYLFVGSPGAIPAMQAFGKINGMVSELSARLRTNPDDVEGWKMLGRSYTVLGRYRQAADAYAKAAAHAPRDAELLADFASALAMAQGQSLAGEPEKLVRRALEIDPRNAKALALAGTASFERQDYAAAAAYWKRMLALVAPGSEDARAIGENIAQAESLAHGADATALQGTVSLSPQLKASAAPDDTVYIFARAENGPPMPLAVARARVRDLPYRFRLDDSMAMTPALRLSGSARVVVAARVSKSGNAMPQRGDLQGSSGPVANDARGVNIVIDKVVD